MKSITVHNIDSQASRKIEELARKNGASLNKTIKMLLYDALGLNKRKQDFSEFCGVWSKDEANVFDQKTAELREIEPDQWK